VAFAASTDKNRKPSSGLRIKNPGVGNSGNAFVFILTMPDQRSYRILCPGLQIPDGGNVRVMASTYYICMDAIRGSDLTARLSYIGFHEFQR
jgi:hypothetical protein